MTKERGAWVAETLGWQILVNMYDVFFVYRTKLTGCVINLCQEKSGLNVCPNPDDGKRGKLKRWESHAWEG